MILFVHQYQFTNMLKPQLNNLSHHHSLAPALLTQGKKNLIPGNGVVDNIGSPSSFLSLNTLAFPTKPHRSFCSRSHTHKSISQIKAGFSDSSTASITQTISLKAVITVQMTVGGVLSNLTVDRAFDDIGDLLGKSLLLELVAAEVDPSKCTCMLMFCKLYYYTTKNVNGLNNL